MKPLKGYEWIYSVTSDGEIYSHKSNRFIKKFLEDNIAIFYAYNGSRKTRKRMFVLRSVAELYVKRPSKEHTNVAPRDGNPLNTSASNAVWITPKGRSALASKSIDNIIDKEPAKVKRQDKHRKQPTAQIAKKGTRHLTEAERADVVRLIDKGYTPGVIANALGVYLDEVMAICHSSKYIKESQYD